MKKMWLIIIVTFLSCGESSKNDIDLLIHSDEPDDLIMGFYLIGENRDTGYINELFQNVNDPRISPDLRFYGMSVYQSKMGALKKISGLNPPKKVNYKPDSAITNFYRKWASENNYFE